MSNWTLSVGPVRLIVLQSSPFCNIDCSYCYLPNRDNKGRITPRVVEALARKLLTENMLDGSVEICWHAGEPLAVPIEHYEALTSALNAVLASAVKIQYSVQTNATLVSADWCDFFARHSVRVGVSLDGPKHVHDKYRVDRAGRGTFDRVMRGIEILRRRGIAPYAIGVLHRESLPIPEEMFRFFQAAGFKEVCFNIEEVDGSNLATSLAFPENYSLVVSFFRRYFELIESTTDTHWLREFSTTLRRLCARTVHNAQTNPFEMLTVDFEGGYSTFSPELIGVSTQEHGSLVLGNVLSSMSFRDSLAAASWVRDIAAGVDDCRQTCKYFNVCGGGAPSNKIAENGSFASTETLECKLGIQAPVEAMLLYFGQKLSSAEFRVTHMQSPTGTFGDLRAEPAR